MSDLTEEVVNNLKTWQPHPLSRLNQFLLDKKPDVPCQLCTRFKAGRCDILGEVTAAKLVICHDAGYCLYPRPAGDSVQRHSLSTGRWAEILEREF